jgi:hypothetical protein
VSHLPASRLARWRAWLPLLALLVALGPLAGAWHRVAHAAGATSATASANDPFGHAPGAAECAVYDAGLTGHAPALAVPLVALPPLVPLAPAAHAPAAPALALGWRLPARGPPRA